MISDISPDSILSRRDVLKSAAASAALALSAKLLHAQTPSPRMTVNLVCGMIGVRANQTEAIELAHRHGFGSVEAMPQYLADLSEEQLAALKAEMTGKGVVFGASGLPVEFRQEEERFQQDIVALPKLAAGLQRAGVTRVGTWLRPGDNDLTYLQNLRQHKRRLGEVARILEDQGLSFGLEYVGTKTLRDRYRFEFVHTMAETKELIAQIGRNNVGFVLDSWHWWNAGETAREILTLEAADVIAVDLNDAPAGIPRERQMDNQRELPLATGVIPVKEFLGALVQIGYHGPVRAEPFNRALNDLDNDQACARTAAALHKAFALVY